MPLSASFFQRQHENVFQLPSKIRDKLKKQVGQMATKYWWAFTHCFKNWYWKVGLFWYDDVDQ